MILRKILISGKEYYEFSHLDYDTGVYCRGDLFSNPKDIESERVKFKEQWNIN